jgi:hypothetical protein
MGTFMDTSSKSFNLLIREMSRFSKGLRPQATSPLTEMPPGHPWQNLALRYLIKPRKLLL